jgi:hypothetical protein
MKNELGNMWKEETMVCFKLLSKNSSGVSEENKEKS